MKVRRWGAAALAGLTALLAGCSGGQDSYNTVAPETDAVVERTVEATGTVGYHEEYSVIPTVSGKILSCSVEEGDTVTAGQVLYVIDSGELEDQITQAQLSLSSAQASYSQAAAACDDLTVTAYASGTVTEVYVHVGDYVNTGTAIAALVDQLLAEHNVHPAAVGAVATIDLKKDETGLLDFCRDRGWPLSCYSAEELAAVEGDFTPSDFVRSVTGVDNVCERAALLGAERLLIKKTARDGITAALALNAWEVRFG